MSDKPAVGVDVSKHWLDKHWLDLCCEGKSERIANTSEAIGAWLERIDPGLVALEPTGGWERVLLAALRERAIAFVRVHPNHLAAFHRSLGVAAKTDRIDAALILAFATDRRARQRVSPGTAEREGLRALAARRRQLVEALHAERCLWMWPHWRACGTAWRRSSPHYAPACRQSRRRSPKPSPRTLIWPNWIGSCGQSLASVRSSPPR
jgi:transposase